jgi:hypothetical protein
VPNSKEFGCRPGKGTYSTLLKYGYQIDAIEIWRPYIEIYIPKNMIMYI